MPYAVRVVEGPGHLEAELTGELTLDDLQAVRLESRELLRAHGLARIVVDASRSTPTQSPTDDYLFTSEHKSVFGAGVRVAVAHRPEIAEHLRFIENVAQNRGFDMRVFGDRAEALAWLLAS